MKVLEPISGHRGPAKLTHQMNHQRKTGAHAQASSTVLVHTCDSSVGVEAVHTLIWGTALSPLCFQGTALSSPSAHLVSKVSIACGEGSWPLHLKHC